MTKRGTGRGRKRVKIGNRIFASARHAGRALGHTTAAISEAARNGGYYRGQPVRYLDEVEES